MTFRIKNISNQLLSVTFNSGPTVHLAPQEISEPMEEIEVKGNQKLEKMKKNSLITIEGEKKKKEKEKQDEKKIEEEEKKGKRIVGKRRGRKASAKNQ